MLACDSYHSLVHVGRTPPSRSLDSRRARVGRPGNPGAVQVTGAASVELADEPELEGLFPECELGAMPPFGNLYGMDVFLADSLAEDETIAFNAGSHTELIRMSYRDYERLVHPTVVALMAKH